jgi:hypothetical protein
MYYSFMILLSFRRYEPQLWEFYWSYFSLFLGNNLPVLSPVLTGGIMAAGYRLDVRSPE